MTLAARARDLPEGQRVVVGLDLGTSALKGVAVDDDGAVVARGRAAYLTERPATGGAEQTVADWFAALRKVILQLEGLVPSKRWRAIGLAAMLPTLVVRDEEGNAVGPAITWEDRRAEPDAELLVEAVGERNIYGLTGQRVDARYLLPMFGRLRRCHRTRVERAEAIGGAKDHLFWYLTGEFLTDPTTATGFGCFDLAQRTWSRPILEAATEVYERLPRLPSIEASTAWRPLHATPAADLGLPSGLPIILGGADSVLGADAVGARSRGDVAYLAGTSTVILGISETDRRDPLQRCLVTPLSGTAGVGLELDLLSTGSALSWMAGLLGVESASQLAGLAATADLETGPLFLPYLASGEQGALWDPSLSAAVVGLHLGQSRADLARALLTGIVIESRRCLKVLDELLGRNGTLYASGLGHDESSFVADLADASGRRVVVSSVGGADHSALGAAMLAAGVVDENLALAHAASLATVEPDPDRAALWESLFERHEEARAAIGHQGKSRIGPGWHPQEKESSRL